MADHPTFTRMERLFLSQNLLILEKLSPEDAEIYAQQRTIIERGYELLYFELLQHVYDDKDTMSFEECSEVWDTLDMFDAIARGLQQFPNTPRKPHYFTKFHGYDGNNEAKFMSFARFTVKELQRFSYIELEKPDYWNSHFPVRDIYGRMLEQWRTVDPYARFKLTQPQLIAVLEAAVHPENRKSS